MKPKGTIGLLLRALALEVRDALLRKYPLETHPPINVHTTKKIGKKKP